MISGKQEYSAVKKIQIKSYESLRKGMNLVLYMVMAQLNPCGMIVIMPCVCFWMYV